jgi:hypothetical protein
LTLGNIFVDWFSLRQYYLRRYPQGDTRSVQTAVGLALGSARSGTVAVTFKLVLAANADTTIALR